MFHFFKKGFTTSRKVSLKKVKPLKNKKITLQPQLKNLIEKMLNAQLKSWLQVNNDSHFPIQNIPFGIFITNERNTPRVCTIIGETVIDIAALAERGYFSELGIDRMVFYKQYLNDLISLGKEKTSALRNRLAEIFSEGNEELKNNFKHREKILHNLTDVSLLMPVNIGDYTDFYSSIEHATNVGIMFRDPANALLPNWKHLPVGYHGRASSIVVSGTNFHRPKGQTKADDAEIPSFGPTKQLDFELEMGFIIGKETTLGNSISTSDAEDYIFGMVLFNDWSARDIQKWEYVPLGPFLGKNFCSSISPWVVTMDALEPFKINSTKQEPQVLPYLQYEGNKNYDIESEVSIQPENQPPQRVSKSNFKYMYWNMCQQLAHHTVNGCNVQVGDLLASGTISGHSEDSYGSMLELAWKGTKPIKMPDGTERKFINDNDTVIMTGFAERDGIKIGFGEVKAKVLPAK